MGTVKVWCQCVRSSILDKQHLTATPWLWIFMLAHDTSQYYSLLLFTINFTVITILAASHHKTTLHAVLYQLLIGRYTTMSSNHMIWPALIWKTFTSQMTFRWTAAKEILPTYSLNPKYCFLSAPFILHETHFDVLRVMISLHESSCNQWLLPEQSPVSGADFSWSVLVSGATWGFQLDSLIATVKFVLPAGGCFLF